MNQKQTYTITSNHRLQSSDGQPVRFTKSPNVSGVIRGPRFLIIHYTATGGLAGTVNWFQQSRSKVSAHLVVGSQGEVVQMVPFNRIAWHAGTSRWGDTRQLNRYAIGIELVNWGLLSHKAGRWTSWTGVRVPEGEVVVVEHKHRPGQKQGWQKFNPVQLEATQALVNALMVHYQIPADHLLGHDDISPRRKIDPGPAFPFEDLKAGLLPKTDPAKPPAQQTTPMFRVTARSGLNFRAGPGREYDKIGAFLHGQELYGYESKGAWWRVQAKDSQDGVDQHPSAWVHGSWLERIN